MINSRLSCKTHINIEVSLPNGLGGRMQPDEDNRKAVFGKVHREGLETKDPLNALPVVPRYATIGLYPLPNLP
jgi:hypothetical protein